MERVMPELRAYVLAKILAVAWCAMLPSVAAAQTPRELTACSSHTPPFVLVENERGVAGFSVDLLKTLATEMKRDLKVMELPWARCLHEVKAARVDIAIDAYDDAERRKSYQYSEPYYTLTPQVFYSASSKAKVAGARSASALAQLKGCGVHEYTYEHYDLEAEKMDRGAVNDLQMIKKLLAGRCDYAVEELEFIIGQREKEKTWPDERELRAFKPEWARGPKLHFLVGRSHPDAQNLSRQLDAGIAAAKTSGLTARLKQKYLVENKRP